jgi:hypothetical protein
MAGRISGEVNAKLLVLNHISPKADYVDDGGLVSLVEDAHKGANGVSEVLLAHDFMEIVVPWLGFGGDTTNATEDQDTNMTTTTTTSAEEQRSKGQTVDTRQVVQDWFREKK